MRGLHNGRKPPGQGSDQPTNGKRGNMRKIGVVIVLGISGVLGATASASAAGPPIKGAGTALGAPDIGTCNNVWANDTLNKTFALFAT